MKKLLYILIFLGAFTTKAQLPQLEIDPVTVTDSLRNLKQMITVIKRPMILELQPEDVGQILQKLAGVNIRSYGGLGGLKTISVRGLGSQHTSIVIDGFTALNNQTGQVNLGQIQTDNIEQLYLVTGAQKNFLVPASAQVAGSAVIIETFENNHGPSKNAVRFSSKMGSYSQLDNSLAYKFSGNRIFLAVNGKYRTADGRYPYVMQNGSETYSGIRNNNRYEDLMGAVSFGWRSSQNGVFKLSLKSSTSDQELPGAVILYSDNAVQTLKMNEHKIQSSYTHAFRNWNLKVFIGVVQNGMEYRDTSYLNNTGGINAHYTQNAMQSGLNARFVVGKNTICYIGTELQTSQLKTNLINFGTPLRNHLFSVAGIRYQMGRWIFTGQVSNQFVNEHNELVTRENIVRVNPFAQVEVKPFQKQENIFLLFSFRNSFRMPAFNELYYNNMGNNGLLPEDANQFSAGFGMSGKKEKIAYTVKTNFFYNHVNNKIVAVPTKNLFVWSMLNVGIVDIRGGECTFDLHHSISKKWSIEYVLNYTFQLATDHTDHNDPTYGHQIAYLPIHAANGDISVHFKNYGVRFSSFFNSVRYSLNENVTANRVEGFAILDATIFGSFKWRTHDLRVQFTCKNFMNTSYAFIRYYVMPGRNYLLSLSYAFN